MVKKILAKGYVYLVLLFLYAPIEIGRASCRERV